MRIFFEKVRNYLFWVSHRWTFEVGVIFKKKIKKIIMLSGGGGVEGEGGGTTQSEAEKEGGRSLDSHLNFLYEMSLTMKKMMMMMNKIMNLFKDTFLNERKIRFFSFLPMGNSFLMVIFVGTQPLFSSSSSLPRSPSGHPSVPLEPPSGPSTLSPSPLTNAENQQQQQQRIKIAEKYF